MLHNGFSNSLLKQMSLKLIRHHQYWESAYYFQLDICHYYEPKNPNLYRHSVNRLFFGTSLKMLRVSVGSDKPELIFICFHLH